MAIASHTAGVNQALNWLGSLEQFCEAQNWFPRNPIGLVFIREQVLYPNPKTVCIPDLFIPIKVPSETQYAAQEHNLSPSVVSECKPPSVVSECRLLSEEMLYPAQGKALLSSLIPHKMQKLSQLYGSISQTFKQFTQPAPDPEQWSEILFCTMLCSSL